MYSIHIGTAAEGIFLRRYLPYVPAVGDVLRIGDGNYVKVVDRTWCLDEGETPYPRANLAVERIKDDAA